MGSKYVLPGFLGVDLSNAFPLEFIYSTISSVHQPRIYKTVSFWTDSTCLLVLYTPYTYSNPLVIYTLDFSVHCRLRWHKNNPITRDNFENRQIREDTRSWSTRIVSCVPVDVHSGLSPCWVICSILHSALWDPILSVIVCCTMCTLWSSGLLELGHHSL